MIDEITVGTQVNESPDTTVNNEQVTEAAEPTVADLHETATEATPKKKVDVVPIARLNKEIQKRKDLEKELSDLRAELLDDDSVTDVEETPEVQQLAERLDKVEKKEQLLKMEASFTANLNKTLESYPEFKDIVNVEVIKEMAFNPKNANKTYKQLLDDAYGNAIAGRRTIETTTPRGGAKDTTVDMKRAQTDGEYRRSVLADPELKKQYNQGLTDRVFR